MVGSIFLVILFIMGIATMFYIVGRFNKIVNYYNQAISDLKKENEDLAFLVRENMKEILKALKHKV